MSVNCSWTVHLYLTRVVIFRSYERQLLLKQSCALSWVPGDELFSLAKAAVPVKTHSCAARIDIYTDICIAHLIQGLIHGVFFVNGSDEIVIMKLLGCKEKDMDVPADLLKGILIGSPTEVTVVLDTCKLRPAPAEDSKPPYVQFFSAAPIRLAKSVIGGLFVADIAPRSSFSIFQKSALLNLADVVSKVTMSQLNMPR